MGAFTVESVSEFVDHICVFYDDLLNEDGLKSHKLVFRGHPDTRYELMPAVGRGRKGFGDISILDEERNLIEMAKYKMPDLFRGDMCPIELLALLQHYGIPTRLLDVTENALVALYFACCENNGADKNQEVTDGCVFSFDIDDYDITNYPILNAIADSYRFAFWSSIELIQFYNQVKIQPYFLEMVGRLDKTDKEANQWIKDVCHTPQFIYAPVRTDRQINQLGRYILFPNRIKEINGKDYFVKQIDPLDDEDECVKGSIIIPKQRKKRILDELTLFGITKESLFRDNPDIVCKDIYDAFYKRVKKEN